MRALIFLRITIFIVLWLNAPAVYCADHPAVAAGDSDGLTDGSDGHWLLRFVPILAGYGLLALAGSFLIKWVRAREDDNLISKNRNCFSRFLRLFAIGRPEYHMNIVSDENDLSELAKLDTSNVKKKEEEQEFPFAGKRNRLRQQTGFLQDCLSLSIYFIGIQTTLVCMGFFQERIITRTYPVKGVPVRMEFFKDAQFLVLANRLVALLLSGSYLFLTWKRQPMHVQPLYLHSFSSFSNVLSSWCQYEALKYVSFPIQTVCKASKIVPTMLMGKLIRRQRYTANEYMLALLLVFGASLFFLSTSSSALPKKFPQNGNQTIGGGFAVQSGMANHLLEHVRTHSSTISGLILMCGYLMFDAITPNWQKKFFDLPPRISTSQMMFAVNAFSVLLCLISLLHQWTLVSSFLFIIGHEQIFFDCLLLSLGSAFGQVFIYLTIKRFGPVVLSIVMTLRQILSIILSSIYFVHPFSFHGGIGLLLVFIAIFLDIYSKYRLRRKGRRK